MASVGFLSVFLVSIVRKMRQEKKKQRKNWREKERKLSSALSPHASQDHLLRRQPTFQPKVQAYFGMPALQATHVLSQRYICDRTFRSDQGPKLETFCFVISLGKNFNPYKLVWTRFDWL